MAFNATEKRSGEGRLRLRAALGATNAPRYGRDGRGHCAAV
jgi:hypothetical protein